MPRLIDADALMSVPNVCKVTEYDESGCGVSYLAVPVEAIEKAPTIDAEPVRHGRWIQRKNVPAYHSCSHCRAAHKMRESCNTYILLNYCPDCGTKMDLEVKDNV